MGELTMEEYMTITRKDHDSGINEKGDDEEVITDNELSNPRDDSLIEENEMAQIFRIDTDIFHFETPLCEAFKELNYLSKINVDIYEWNNGISWINENPWTDDGVWTEPIDNIYHECNPLRFKNGTAKWPTCNWKEDRNCKTRDLHGFIREGNSISYEDYEWYATLEDSEVKAEVLNNKAILEESMNIEGESSDDAWSHYSLIDEWKDYEHTTYIETDASSNQNTYNNVCQIVMDHSETQGKRGWFNEHELIGDNDDDIGDLEDYLIQKDPP
ncbi:hypothetical protein Tco_0210330 [Tanacetum coccineum]